MCMQDDDYVNAGICVKFTMPEDLVEASLMVIKALGNCADRKSFSVFKGKERASVGRLASLFILIPLAG